MQVGEQDDHAEVVWDLLEGSSDLVSEDDVEHLLFGLEFTVERQGLFGGEALIEWPLVVIDELMTSSTRLYASPAAMNDDRRRRVIDDIGLLIGSVLGILAFSGMRRMKRELAELTNKVTSGGSINVPDEPQTSDQNEDPLGAEPALTSGPAASGVA